MVLIGFLLIAGVFAGLTVYPSVFFANTLNARNMVVYSREPIDMSSADLLGRVRDKVFADEFADAGQTFEVYLGSGYGKYALLAPFCGKTFACMHPLSGKIFVALADMQKNQALDPADPSRTRVLEHVIAHEAVKAQLRNKLGPLKYFTLKEWQTDGYAEHVAMETADADPALICQGAAARDPRALFFKHRLVIEDLKMMEDLTYPAIMEGNRTPDKSIKNVTQKYCR
ncbi:MAG TPA: hypothetical protein DCZ92_12010 [Elusimicrobia bacterium]|nr:MAG: hypothetical protein A2016_01555 [Elusimicrobia bacterium GWF2_62_30]HBA61515.1 hypothetical protein [Elusimicrobiota bacterium]